MGNSTGPRWEVNPVRSLFDAALHHECVKITCRRCRHQIIYDPHALWWLFERKGWMCDLRDVVQKLTCGVCKAKRPFVDLTKEEPTGHLALPSPEEWKRALRRHR